MKILTICGSPRKKGNTGKVLNMFNDEISDGHEIEHINLIDFDVKGCIGCMKCQEDSEEPGCVQNDDANSIFGKMMDADAVVYASPLYCWSFTAQMKPLIDRHFCMCFGYGTPEYKSFLEGKKVALLVTCGGPIEKNTEFIQGIFDNLSGFMNMNNAGKYLLPSCTEPEAIGEEGKTLAAAMAKAITS